MPIARIIASCALACLAVGSAPAQTTVPASPPAPAGATTTLPPDVPAGRPRVGQVLLGGASSFYLFLGQPQ